MTLCGRQSGRGPRRAVTSQSQLRAARPGRTRRNGGQVNRGRKFGTDEGFYAVNFKRGRTVTSRADAAPHDGMAGFYQVPAHHSPGQR